MRYNRWKLLAALLCVAQLATVLRAQDAAEPWPPKMPGADANGVVTLSSPEFLTIPATAKADMEKPGAGKFTVAKTAPKVDLVLHGGLPNQALNGTGWSAWGDIWAASDGKVYSGVGDHGDDVGGKAHVYIYEYDPQARTLKQVVDGNAVGPRSAGDVTFSKTHAGIQETKDGKILIICTLNDGGTAGQVKWSETVPGSQIIEYDPATGQAQVVGVLEKRATATTIMDQERGILYISLEGNEDKEIKAAALGAFDTNTHEWVFRSQDGIDVAHRNYAIDRQGNVYFTGPGGELWKYEVAKKQVGPSGMKLPTTKQGDKEAPQAMRASTAQTKDGWLYGVTHGGPGQLFRFHPETSKVEMLGPDFGSGHYTTVAVLSPDEKYVYYLPGAHGGARDIGTPVVQYNIASGERKVLAFLRDPFEKQEGVVLAGTYGVKLNQDGSVLYVNFNGHAGDSIRPEKMPASGFGLTSFAAIHIPESER